MTLFTIKAKQLKTFDDQQRRLFENETIAFFKSKYSNLCKIFSHEELETGIRRCIQEGMNMGIKGKKNLRVATMLWLRHGFPWFSKKQLVDQMAGSSDNERIKLADLRTYVERNAQS